MPSHTRTRIAAFALLAAAAALTACEPDGTDAKHPDVSIGVTATTATRSSGRVPALVGKGLQAAQDAAQKAGFRNLTSHDSAGRARHQILDRDWKVCSQRPAAGSTVKTGTTIDLGAVKLDETCPATDQSPPAEAGATMPDYIGKALNTATGSLPSGTSISTSDAAGSRVILLQSNWKVCTQSPAPGAALKGQPVKFTAVKFGEGCP
ncbi:PASTA domain-containing protein [Streptomyces sp. NBC_01476]|uniref:PASTA domain-containing protein n=1 Tax=Streptomyces sp. NBC_01476 TaxID=2903881 RepID=UPI002E307F51|nr:PASTA domain-containing protein [Streptomyces sp. NBC_01476]